MKTRTLKQLLLYNYRYLFAYVVITSFMVYFLGWQLGSIGPGLSLPEISTAAQHTTLSDLIALPLYPLHSVLQFLGIHLFGVSAASLRLPSVIIALLTAIVLYNLLKKWFGKQTALLSTALFVSADWFLFIARLSTGSIEFSFWLVLALFCYTKLVEHKARWLILFSVALACLLFVPFGPYAAITLAVSLLGYKLFRDRVLAAHMGIKIVSTLILLIGFAAAVYASFKNIDFLKNILVINSLPSVTEYFKNVFTNTAAVVAVTPDANPLISPTGIFFVRFFELIFIIFGVIMFWKTRVNRLNLTVLILSVVLVLASGFSAGSRGNGILLIPAIIYITAGIRHLMHRWKRTFPKNPYARVVAYLPLGVLFICTVALHYFSYFWLWPSQTATNQVFTPDLQLAQTELNKPKYAGKLCFVHIEDQDMQKLLRASNTQCELMFPSNATVNRPFAVELMGSNIQIMRENTTVRALTSETKDANVRWLVLESTK